MKSLIYLSGILLFISCGSSTDKSSKNDLSALKKEVMAIHDEVMPKMGDLRKTRKSILLLVDSVSTDSLKQAQLIQISDELDMPNEGMMQWMRQYEPNLQASEDSLWSYYSSQKSAIEEVSSKMNVVLKKGQEILK